MKSAKNSFLTSPHSHNNSNRATNPIGWWWNRENAPGGQRKADRGIGADITPIEGIAVEVSNNKSKVALVSKGTRWDEAWLWPRQFRVCVCVCVCRRTATPTRLAKHWKAENQMSCLTSHFGRKFQKRSAKKKKKKKTTEVGNKVSRVWRCQISAERAGMVLNKRLRQSHYKM